MLITRCPYRVSLFGSSTDHRSFSSVYGSLQIGMPINKYSYLAMRETPEILPYYTKVQYSEVELVEDNFQIRHNGVRGCLQFMNWTDPIEIIHFCDVPAATGLGSSSAFILALLKGLHALEGNTTISPKSLAKQAIYVERDLLKEPGGQKDQCLCATNTGLSSIEIETNGDFHIKPLWVSKDFCDYLVSCMSLLYAGHGRESFKIASDLDKPETTEGKLQLLENAHFALDAFQKQNIFGKNGVATLLNDLWQIKRNLSPLISNPTIDGIYEKAMNYGGIGFNLLGAGSTGFCLVLSRSEDKDRLVENIGLPEVPFNIDYSGPQIVLNAESIKT